MQADGNRPDFAPSAQLYPFDSRWFDSSAGRLHYVDEGRGPAILMCHGNPTWSFLYRQLIRTLQGTFRCIAVDYLGFGLSDRPPGYGYTPAEHAGVVGELVRELDLKELIVMGHDWGGPIGLSVATADPERIAGLVLGNTWFWPSDRQARAFSRVMSSAPMQRITYPMRDFAFPHKQVLPKMRAAFKDVSVVDLPRAKHFFLEDAPQRSQRRSSIASRGAARSRLFLLACPPPSGAGRGRTRRRARPTRPARPNPRIPPAPP
jgi:pimeloyl-ACP methyl ester carboxylesterase